MKLHNNSISISVIIPTYNRWPAVSRAIDSVIAQTEPGDEIIVVDDGSIDHTSENLRLHYGKRIKIIKQANHGVSHARNRGIEQATGNWIALLDSDDEWMREKLQKQKAIISANRECVLCHTNEIWIRDGKPQKQMKKHTKFGGDIFRNCLPLCVISPSSALIKRDIFSTTGLFDETLPACEDYDLWLRICCKHPTHYLAEPLLIKYGGHDDQLSKKYWGMDRFRIQSLHKLLRQTMLTEAQRQNTLDMLEQKTIILLKGAVKHHNHEQIEQCRSLAAEYSFNVPDALQ